MAAAMDQPLSERFAPGGVEARPPPLSRSDSRRSAFGNTRSVQTFERKVSQLGTTKSTVS